MEETWRKVYSVDTGKQYSKGEKEDERARNVVLQFTLTLHRSSIEADSQDSTNCERTRLSG